MPHLTVCVLVFLVLRHCARVLTKKWALTPHLPVEKENFLYDKEWSAHWEDYNALQKGHRRQRRNAWRSARTHRYALIDACALALAATLFCAGHTESEPPITALLPDEASPACDVAGRGITACVLGVALEPCLATPTAARYCLAGLGDEWLEPITSPLRHDSVAQVGVRARRHFLSETGERYATQYALKVSSTGQVALQLVLVREIQLQTQLQRIHQSTGAACLCAPQLGLIDNCSFVAHEKRWILRYDAESIQRTESGVVFIEFSEDTTRVNEATRSQLTEYNNRLHEQGYKDLFILRQSDASQVQRVRLPLNGEAAACFLRCAY